MNQPLAYKDYTIKAVVTDERALEARLYLLGAQFIGVDQQKDTYFLTSKGKLKLREGNIENLITQYERIDENGMEKTIVYRYDINPTPEEINSLYDGRTILGVVKKQRKIFFIERVKIHIDRMPDDKVFVEIEAIDSTNSTSSEELKAACLETMKKLHISRANCVKTGYLPNG